RPSSSAPPAARTAASPWAPVPRRPAASVGADSAKVLGPALTSMMESFQGTPETTYDPSLNDFRPPGYDQDRAGEILADLTPLGKDSPTGTGDKLSKLNSNYWATQ
ncbi:hypothetical protein AB0P45_17445, partial [Streptomyces niveus]